MRRRLFENRGGVLPRNLLAQGRLRSGAMNKTEAAYSQELGRRIVNGELLWHKFEAIKLRLADNTFYSPDFLVMAADLVLEIHEVKSFWMDDARVKIKVAADLYPFRFIAAKPRTRKQGGGWEFERFERKENGDGTNAD